MIYITHMYAFFNGFYNRETSRIIFHLSPKAINSISKYTKDKYSRVRLYVSKQKMKKNILKFGFIKNKLVHLCIPKK